MALPTVAVEVDGEQLVALVDSGCSRTVVARRLVKKLARSGGSVTMVDGGSVMVDCKGEVTMTVFGQTLTMECMVLAKMLTSFELILGMDFIRELGGVWIGPNKVELALLATKEAGVAERPLGDGLKLHPALGGWPKTAEDVEELGLVSTKQLVVEDVDFSATFDGSKWMVKWRWIGLEPSSKFQVANYRLRSGVKEEFDKEVESWISEGILVEVGPEDEVKTLVPLLAVEQVN